MATFFRITLLVVILTGCAVSMLGHHSVSAEFDVAHPVKLTGLVTRVAWGNPHALVFVDVRNEQTGGVLSWVLQLPSPNIMAKLGWPREPFKSGILVTVNGYRAKDGSRKGTVHDVTSSGRTLFTAETERAEAR
jgi:hypothetical protein